MPELGCPEWADSACGNGNTVNQSLADGASADEMLDSAQTALDVASATEIPIISQAAGLVNAGIDGARGDYMSAGLGIVGLIPIAGNTADAIRLTKRLGGRLGNSATRHHVATIVTEAAERGWTLVKGGLLEKEEYLKPLLGGRKGGPLWT